VLDLPVPGHLGDMHQTLNPVFQFHESPVIGDADYFPLNLRPDRITTGNSFPRVFRQLLHPQRNSLLLLVKFQNLDIYLFTYGEDLRGMLHTSPRKVRDVEKTVDTTKINKRSVIGDIFYNPFHDTVFLENLEGFFLLALPLLLEQHPA